MIIAGPPVISCIIELKPPVLPPIKDIIPLAVVTSGSFYAPLVAVSATDDDDSNDAKDNNNTRPSASISKYRGPFPNK